MISTDPFEELKLAVDEARAAHPEITLEGLLKATINVSNTNALVRREPEAVRAAAEQWYRDNLPKAWNETLTTKEK